MSSTFHIFADQDFDAVTRDLSEKLKARIFSENKNYLLNVNRSEYLDHIVGEFEISPLGLDFDNTSVSTYEKFIPSEYFPSDFGVFEGESYSKQVVTYHIPFAGDEQLLRCVPSPRIINSHPVFVEHREVCFEIIDFYGDPSRIKPDADSALNLIRQQAAYLEKNISQYNQGLRKQAESLFDGVQFKVRQVSSRHFGFCFPVVVPFLVGAAGS
ncbi:MAG: hypothetical protein L0387_14165 [Acidobacteria bacterium]|nr:hypothetical protein [Acidobacteriota bacterium]